jgi:hypothetical protein
MRNRGAKRGARAPTRNDTFVGSAKSIRKKIKQKRCGEKGSCDEFPPLPLELFKKCSMLKAGSRIVLPDLI